MKRIIAVILGALLAVVSLSACGAESPDGNGFQALFKLESEAESEEGDNEPEAVTRLNLPYDPTDAGDESLLDPFTAKTSANRYICGLIYDPLFKPDESFKAQPCVAEAVKYSSEVLSEFETAYYCTVRIRTGLKFSDGSELGRDDVIYSLSLALKDGSMYRDELANIMSWTRIENGIVFRLYQPDHLFESLLAFPIVKKGSGDEIAYVGSGRYRPVLVSETLHLIENEEYHEAGGPIDMITLVEVEDGDMLMYSLKTGAVDFAFFRLDNDTVYNAASGTQYAPLNNMIFLGLNGVSGETRYASVRNALNLALDRDALITAYSGMAAPAYTPQNPLFCSTSWEDGDTAAARMTLAEADFVRDEEGWFERNGRRLTLTLLVNREDGRRQRAAELIAAQLGEAGIEVVIESCSFEEYSARLAAGDYELYLGEIKLKSNMDISTLLPGGRAAYSTAASEELMAVYARWRAGGSVNRFNEAFREELPFLPLMFRFGQISFSREISYDITATEQDIFYNILNW